MSLLKVSTARNLTVFMTDSTDHVTGKTGLTLTITASKDGAAFNSITPVVTELANGWYSLALTTTHTNTKGDLILHVTATGADPSDLTLQVVTDLPGDSISSVTNAVTISAGTGTGQLDFTSGVVKVNLVQILGTALTETSGQIAAGFKQFFNIASPTSTMNTITTVTTATNLTTNNDKTGYTLSAAGIQAIWDALTSALTTVGSIGKLLVTNIDTTISSRLASGSYTAPPSASTIAQAVWDVLTSAITTASSIGKLIKDNLDVAISTRMATFTYTTPPTVALIRAEMDSNSTKLANLDVVLSTRAAAATALSTSDYTAARALKLDNLDTTISSRLATSGYTAPDNTTIGTINTNVSAVKTDTTILKNTTNYILATRTDD